MAKQVRQVGFWIIAAQAGIALALGIPGEAVMGVVGAAFVGGTGALAFLLAAEVVAATAAVSEAALVYVARHRNLMISTLMIAVQAALTVVFILGVADAAAAAGDSVQAYQAAERGGGADARARPRLDPQGAPALPAARRAGPGLALASGLGRRAAAVAGRLGCSRRCRSRSNGSSWRSASRRSCSRSGSVVWLKGFTHDDRVLFRLKKGEEPELPPPPGTTAAAEPRRRPPSGGSGASR